MNAFHVIIVAATAYLAVGAVIGLVHPSLFRSVLADIRNAEFVRGGVFWKPVMASVFFALICVLWPVAWFKRRQSERTATQIERLRPFVQLYAAANSPVRYAGGDGSSYDNAVMILGANMLSGVVAERDYIQQRYPGCELRKQSLHEHDRRRFDLIEFVTVAGDEKLIYFDISAFHCKAPQTPPWMRSEIAEK